MASESNITSEALSDNDKSSTTAMESDAHDVSPTDSSANGDRDVEKAATTMAQGAAGGGLQWDGPDDPDNPLNWSASMRNGQVILIASLLLLVLVPSYPSNTHPSHMS